MLSSLEALDAEDNLHTTPVPRHGAFQPKAKARARKGGSSVARAPSSSLPCNTNVSTFAASSANNDNDKSQDDAARIGKEADTSVVDLESNSIVIACETFNKVGIETPPTNHSEITAGPETTTNLNFDGDVVSDCQIAAALHELGEVHRNFGGPIVEVSGSIDRSLQTLSEQAVIVSLSLENDSESPPVVCNAPLPVSEGLGLHSFGLVEPGAEHVTEVEGPCKQLSNGVEDRIPSALQESTGSPRKTRRLQKDKEDDLQAVEVKGCTRLPKDSSDVGKGVRVACEAKFTKSSKKKEHSSSDPNEGQDMVSVGTNLNSQTMNKRAKTAGITKNFAQETIAKGTAQPVEKKTRRNKHADERRDEGEQCASSINEALSKKEKKLCSADSYDTSPSQTNLQVEVRTCGPDKNAEEAVGIAEMNEQGRIHIDDHEELGEACTGIGTCKRKIRKPARYLDGADEEEIVSAFTTKGTKKVPKENGTQESQSATNRCEEFAENDLLSQLFPNLPKKIFKLKQSKVTGFNTTVDPISSLPSMEAREEPNGSGEPVAPAEDNQKKKFKKLIHRRRRVERRAMNPADPDLDPKKMTMKDIIRLAEAKERMLKKDNAENAKKSGNQVTMDEPARELDTDSTFMAPQVQIVDGQIVINEESLVRQAHPRDDIRTYRRVEETHSKLNYHSYMKRTQKYAWRPEETELFYQALREFGTNFEMIQHLFPGRARKHVLLKFKKEERCNPLRIAEAMRVKPCDTSHFVEVISSLNLLPTEMVEEHEIGQTVGSVEQSFSTKELLDDTCGVRGGARQSADGIEYSFKVDEPSVDSICREEIIGSSPNNVEASYVNQNNEVEELATEEAAYLADEAKPSESPERAPKPITKKKSLFSYQTSAAKL